MIGEVQRVPAAMFHELARGSADPSHAEKLRGIKARTLLLWGERDEVVPLERGEALARRLSARLEVLPGAGHPCYLEQPERFHALLLGFLGTLQ